MEQKPTPFLSDIQEIRRRAREHVEKGAVTPAYKGDVETAIKLLNEALATEIVCTLRYRRHHFMAAGIHYQAIADEFMKHAQEEQGHADKIAERIAIESYLEMIRYFGDNDPTSRRMMESILAVEEEHADDMATLLETLDPREPADAANRPGGMH